MQGGTQLYLPSNLCISKMSKPLGTSQQSDIPEGFIFQSFFSLLSEKLHAHELQWWCVLLFNAQVSPHVYPNTFFYSFWLPYCAKEWGVIPYSHFICINVLQISFTYYISCFSPGQKILSHLLILHIKENDHWLTKLGLALPLSVWSYKTTNLLLFTCNLPGHQGLICGPLIKQLFYCTSFF